MVVSVLAGLLASRASNSAKERAALSSSARHSTHKSFLFAKNLTVGKLYSHLCTHLRTIPYLQHALSRRRCPSWRIPSPGPILRRAAWCQRRRHGVCSAATPVMSLLKALPPTGPSSQFPPVESKTTRPDRIVVTPPMPLLQPFMLAPCFSFLSPALASPPFPTQVRWLQRPHRHCRRAPH